MVLGVVLQGVADSAVPRLAGEPGVRRIAVPASVIRKALNSPSPVEFAVEVDWPELRLTEDQMLANAVAAANGEARPFPYNRIFTVVLESPLGGMDDIAEMNNRYWDLFLKASR